MLTFFFRAAYPWEPFPYIHECDTTKGSFTDNHKCILQSVPPMNVTCSVFGYYPSISLYFQQNATKLDAISSAEWNNTDGTRNKTVTITAVSGDVSYTCLASDVPGTGREQQETTVVFASAVYETTTMDIIASVTTKENGPNRARMISKLKLISTFSVIFSLPLVF